MASRLGSGRHKHKLSMAAISCGLRSTPWHFPQQAHSLASLCRNRLVEACVFRPSLSAANGGHFMESHRPLKACASILHGSFFGVSIMHKEGEGFQGFGVASPRQKQAVRTYAGQRKAASPIRETRWKRRLQEFKDNPHELRIVLQDEKYIKEDEAIAAMARMVQAFGLYCQAYAKGMVIMKEPMPNFSPVYDRKPKQRRIGMSVHTAKHIHDIITKSQEKRKERLAALVGQSKAADGTSVPENKDALSNMKSSESVTGLENGASSGGQGGGSNGGVGSDSGEGFRVAVNRKVGNEQMGEVKQGDPVLKSGSADRDSDQFFEIAADWSENGVSATAEPSTQSMQNGGFDPEETSLDLPEKLLKLAPSGSGVAGEPDQGLALSETGAQVLEVVSASALPSWRSYEDAMEDSDGSETEFVAEDKSDLELLDVLIADRMKVNARVEGVKAGEAGLSRRDRRNSALQGIAELVERNKGAFTEEGESDDGYVDKSRWKKLEGGPHDGIRNSARKSVRKALREAEQRALERNSGQETVGRAPILVGATAVESTSKGTEPVDRAPSQGAEEERFNERRVNFDGASTSGQSGSVPDDVSTGVYSKVGLRIETPFSRDVQEAAGSRLRDGENGPGPSFRNGAAAGVYRAPTGTSSSEWEQRDINRPVHQSGLNQEGGAGTNRAAAAGSEGDDYLSASVGVEEREMEFRPTRRGRRGVEPMPHVRRRAPYELKRADNMLEGRRRLPAWSVREGLLEAVANNQVVIVSGETGCGKTTQLPQFVLEDADANGMQCNIICTQPRRISAVSVAARVANERGEQPGDTVGYAVRLDQKRSQYTRLLYCTTGVLLRMMISDPALTHVTHIMVDEIHERGRDEDFLLIVLRDILPKRPDLRLILMSATLNARLFSHYFGDAPVMHIPGFTYPVESLFLEDVLQLTGYTLVQRQNEKRHHWRYQLYNPHKPLELKPEMFPDYPRHVQQSIAKFNDDETLGPDLALVEALICHICCGKGAGRSPRVLTAHDRHLGPMRPLRDMAPEGAVLVFLTGWEDIQDLMDLLRKNPRLSRLEGQGRVQIMALHGQMPGKSQKLIFERPPPGVRKIVLATNLAETSVTIDDVVHVIDCGLAKEHRYDPLNKLSSLDVTWISKASARQRRGRAGRVQPGICYHLYPQSMYNKRMAEYAAPEMLRTPLEELCLQVKSLEPIMGQTSIESILSRAMEPPDKRTIDIGVKMLQSIGAVDRDENLTPLGKHMSELPIDPRLGKMLLMGATFQCLGPILTIAAALSHKDPFSMPGTHKWAALEAKLALAGNTESDHVALMRAFEGWMRARDRGLEHEFCREYFLSNATMSQIDVLRKQYARILVDMGFVNRKAGWEAYNEYAADTYLVRAVLCSGMYPQIVGVTSDKAYGRVTYTFKDMDAADVDLHPMSVNHKRNEYKLPWMVYSNKIKTAKIYVRDSTPVCDLALVVFGGEIESEEGSGLLKMFDGYIMFTSDRLTATLVKGLRNELHALLQAKLMDPRLDIRAEGLDIIEGVRDLLQSGITKGGFGHDMI